MFFIWKKIMQLNYLNKPYFENGSIKNISSVLQELGVKIHSYAPILD